MSDAEQTVYVLRRPDAFYKEETFCVLVRPAGESQDASADTADTQAGRFYYAGTRAPSGAIDLTRSCRTGYRFNKGGTVTFRPDVSERDLQGVERITVRHDGTMPAMVMRRQAGSREAYVPVNPDDCIVTFDGSSASLVFPLAYLAESKRSKLAALMPKAQTLVNNPRQISAPATMTVLDELSDVCQQIAPHTSSGDEDDPDIVRLPATFIHYYQWLHKVIGHYNEGRKTKTKVREMLLRLYTGPTTQLLVAATRPAKVMLVGAPRPA
jgi:hypothetical protein